MSSTASPTAMSPQSFTSSQLDDRNPLLYKHRKAISTGGGRAWSDEEETYLIETRLHKMPYKHIAAHLQKTELACRLHYHQLSFGTKRRRRTISVSSAKSTERVVMSSIRRNTSSQQALPALSPPDTPENLDTVTGLLSQSPLTHVPILPKPVTGSQRVVQHSNALRLITQDIGWTEGQSRVDTERLSRIYEAHRSHFWSMVARDYGDNVSPVTLEDTWRKAVGVTAPNLPLTPNGSPHSTKVSPSILSPAFSTPADPRLGSGFSPINVPRTAASTPCLSTRGTFAISSLLTEDKEVRSPNHEKRAVD